MSTNQYCSLQDFYQSSFEDGTIDVRLHIKESKLLQCNHFKTTTFEEESTLHLF